MMLLRLADRRAVALVGATCALAAYLVAPSIIAGLVAPALAVGTSDGPRAADAITAQHLMQLLARTTSSRADFVDLKYLKSLDRPLESSGELIYTAPARLERRTLEPKPETLVIDGDTLSIERNGTRRTISLSSYPEIAAFTESIRATLAGDLASLQRGYRVIVDGTTSQWTLTLLPSDPKIANVVSRMTIKGHDERVESFEVLQADGNRSVTTLAPHAAGGTASGK